MIIAKLNNLRIAPRKTRLIVDLIRGLNVSVAESQLKNMAQKSARPILKLLNSAVANAENNFKLKKDNLYIKEIFVDEGAPLKRWMPKAYGRASQILKKSSHITIKLEEKIKTLKVAEKIIKEKNKSDVKIVSSLDEIKKENKQEKITLEINKKEGEDHEPVKKDVKDLSLKNTGSKKAAARADRPGHKKFGKIKKLFQRKTI